MNLLLDTHAFLWSVADPDSLDEGARRAIEDPGNLVSVSAATVWEVGIKRAVGKLEFDGSVLDAASLTGFDLLAMSAIHAELAGDLPPHHRDPFDRMLIAQAQVEGLTIVTRDPAFGAYEVAALRA